jgi:hypothetical protein
MLFCIFVAHIYTNMIDNSQRLFLVKAVFHWVSVADVDMKPPSRLRFILKQCGYSDNTIREIWKWYNFSDRRGVASY